MKQNKTITVHIHWEATSHSQKSLFRLKLFSIL